MTKYLLVTILLLLLVCGLLVKHNRNLSEGLSTSKQTVLALTDSIRVHKDRKTGAVTLQKPVFTQRLDPKQVKLTAPQKALFKAVDKKTVAGAVITSTVEVRDVVNTTPTLADSVQVFSSHTDSLSYHITVHPGKLVLDSLTIPNTQTITFQDTRKETTVNITNSNPLLKTQDIQGYVLKKKKISLLAKIINLIF